MKYVEEYKFGDRTCGISYESDRGSYAGREKVYKVWVSGSCIGSDIWISLARTMLHKYAVQEAHRQISSAKAQLSLNEKIVSALGNDPFHLGKFRVES